MERSKLLSISVFNLGCIGPEGLTIELDNILCLVGSNNTGKSTILRAYELAVGTETYSIEKDYCKRSKGQNSVIEICVHIPENTANIAEKWKEKKEDYLVVKSKWEWDSLGKKVRYTWNPEIGSYSEDGNAAGLDNVFNSRLPTPFRIGALQNPQQEFKRLLNLVVQPIAENLKGKLDDKESELSKALTSFTSEAKKPVEEHQKKINEINEILTKNHNRIFPNLTIDLQIGIAEPKIDPADSLAKGSKLNIKEWEEQIDWEHQGTGSQRALFWSLLQVRSKLQALNDFRSEGERRLKALEKEIKKVESERDKAKKDDTKKEKEDIINTKIKELEELKALEPEKAFEEKNDEISLPGYMLLIDEPEVALHPNAIRAASQYLYELANDTSWQVMITTHSPLFISPLSDHTTIVRLSRDIANPTPKTYRSDKIKFTEDEIEELKLINAFDQALAEMFFGQYPIIVEGDTEFASFQRVMSLNIEKYPLSKNPVLIRARGKFSMIPIMKMLSHFKVQFSILHDADNPRNSNGNKNNAWSGNESIYNEILLARKANVKVIHRVSISTFETEHTGVRLSDTGMVLKPANKEKPWIMYDLIKKNEEVKRSVENVYDDLLNSKANEEPFDKDFITGLNEHFKMWVSNSGIKDLKFQLD